MKYKIKAYNIWEKGPREKQEDSIYPEFGKSSDSDRLFILCDGMGGHSAGEVASGTVCEKMSEYILSECPDQEGEFTDSCLQEALEAAFDALDANDNGAERKMGTTLTFLKLHNKGCTIAHIGDSRVYHIRPGQTAEDTEILFQTEDHSLVNDLIRIGELTPEEARHSNQKNVITRAMQPCMSHRPKADIYHTGDIKPGDYFLLCSDGILEQMEDENIKYIFSAKGGEPDNKVDIIIKATSQNRDNHSAHLVHVLEVSDSEIIKSELPPMMAEVEDSDVPEADDILPMDSNIDGVPGHSNKLWIVVIIAALLFGGYYVYKNYIKESGADEPEVPRREAVTGRQPGQPRVTGDTPKPENPSQQVPDKDSAMPSHEGADEDANPAAASEQDAIPVKKPVKLPENKVIPESDKSMPESDEPILGGDESIPESNETIPESNESKANQLINKLQ